MDADTLPFYQEATHFQVEQLRVLQQQRTTLEHPSPQLKREPDAEEEIDTVPTTLPSHELVRYHKSTAPTASQKENLHPTISLPFRAINWNQPPHSHQHLQQKPRSSNSTPTLGALHAHQSPSRRSRHISHPVLIKTESELFSSSSSSFSSTHTHPDLSFSPPQRTRHKSTPLPLPFVKTDPYHSSFHSPFDTPTATPRSPLTARRTTISNVDWTAEGKRVRKRQKREWKMDLKLREN
ncbi:MAG: hypothetical protein Q9197_004746, partial [Variospora fuerteventurae]